MICGLCITAFRRYLKKKMKTNLYLHSERLQEFFRKPGEPVRGQVVEVPGQVVDNEREEMSFGFSSSTVLQNAAQPEVNQDIKQGPGYLPICIDELCKSQACLNY